MSSNNVQHDAQIKVLITVIIALLFPISRSVLCQMFSYDFGKVAAAFLNHKTREWTWMATFPTNELTISLNVSSFESMIRSQRSIPYGFSRASDRMIDSRKQSKVIRSRPICGHWHPMPVNTNHTGRTPDDIFWTQHIHTPVFTLIGHFSKTQSMSSTTVLSAQLSPLLLAEKEYLSSASTAKVPSLPVHDGPDVGIRRTSDNNALRHSWVVQTQ